MRPKLLQHPKKEDVGFLVWASYWLDVYGPDGRPSNSKVLSTIGFSLAWIILFVWGWRAENLGGDYVMALGLVLSIAVGKDGFKAAVKMKNRGSTGSVMRSRRQDGLDDPLVDDES